MRIYGPKNLSFPGTCLSYNSVRGGSRAAGTSKVECFVIIVNSVQSLTIIRKHSTLDVAAALDPPLSVYHKTILLKTHSIYELDYSFRQKQKACDIQRTARLLPLGKSELRVIFSIFVITGIIFATLKQLKCLIRVPMLTISEINTLFMFLIILKILICDNK